MAICKVCGNDYPNAFEITRHGQRGTYDSFECAIHDMAPTCAHCSCRIIGHGVAAGEMIYCCAHCARQHGVTGLADSTEQDTPARQAASPAGVRDRR